MPGEATPLSTRAPLNASNATVLGVNATSFRDQGEGIAALLARGFTVDELVDAGFSRKDVELSASGAQQQRGGGSSSGGGEGGSGTTAGVVIGTVVGLALVGAAFFYRRRSQMQTTDARIPIPFDTPKNTNDTRAPEDARHADTEAYV
jgi:hypothetical protein